MRSYTNLRGAFRATGASLPFLSRRAHLLTTCEAGGGIPSVGRARALFTNCPSDTSPERAGNAASQHSLCSRRFCGCRDCCLSHQSGRYSARLLPAKTCHRQLYRRYGQQCSPFSLCKEKQKPRGGVLPPPHKIRIEVNANGNLPLGGKGGQPGSRTLRLCSLRLSQLLPHPQ